jgi:hypothetical protein
MATHKHESESLMYKNLGVTLAIAVVLVLASGLQAAPKMTLPETEFNFGYAPQHSDISHVFWIHSTGDDSLKILNVVPG